MKIPTLQALSISLFDGGRLVKAVYSQPAKDEPKKRITVEPLQGKYQFAEYADNKVTHRNLGGAEAKAEFERLCGLYRQTDIRANGFDCKVLSGKGRMTITARSVAEVRELSSAHDRVRNYILKDGVPADFLVQLGIMEKSGRVKAAGQKKFRQINRYLEMIRDVEHVLPEDAHIVDFGCGKAYLSFALYYYLHEIQGKNVSIFGLDLKRDVVLECEKLARELGYTGLSFSCGSIEDFDSAVTPDMVISLHACDTATDYAIYQAYKWGAKVIMAVPCCQHELNAGLRQGGILFRYGLIKERTAALMTDAIRAEIMRLWGYSTDVMEFIDMEHTPKNILIRGCKKIANQNNANKKKSDDAELRAYIKELGVEPTLWRLYNHGL